MNLWKLKKYKDKSIDAYPHFAEYEDFYNRIIDKHFPQRNSPPFLSAGMHRDFTHRSYTRYNATCVVAIETYGELRNKKISMQFKYNFKTGQGQWKRINNESNNRI